MPNKSLGLLLKNRGLFIYYPKPIITVSKSLKASPDNNEGYNRATAPDETPKPNLSADNRDVTETPHNRARDPYYSYRYDDF